MTETPAQRQRHEALDRISRDGYYPLGPTFTTKVVGVSFTPQYPANLHALDHEWREGRNDYGLEPLPAILIRNPDNEHDSNAIQVHVPALGAGAFVGHLTSPIAARLAPELDAGVPWRADVVDVLIHPSHPDRPGISVRLTRIPQEDDNG